MKIRLLALSLSVFLVFACKNNDHKEAKETESVVVSRDSETQDEIPVKQCYLYASDQDTISLNISKLDSIVTGSLIYSYFEKDINRGQISGMMHGDTLVADYIFESEGTTSQRKVIFVQEENKLVEAFTASDSTGLKLNEDFALTRTNCGVN